MFASERRMREAGFTAHLVKPIDFDELKRTIQHLQSSLHPRQGT